MDTTKEPVRGPSRERGATAVEYALLVALIAVAILIGVGAFGVSVVGLFDDANTSIPLSS